MSVVPDDRRAFFQFACRYAYRNLQRNRRRTVLTVLTVLFSVSVAIISNRYSRAIMRLWEEAAVETGTAHAQLHAQGYWQRQEGLSKALTIERDTPVEKRIHDDPDIVASVRRMKIEGLASTAEESLYFVGIGIEPAAELIVSPQLFNAGAGGHDKGSFVTDADKTGVTVGVGLAESLGLKIGDPLTLITNTADGSVNGIDANVVGIVNVGIPSFNKRVIYAHIELLQKLVRLPNRYTELAIRLKPDVDPEAWTKKLKADAETGGLELRGWWEVEPVIRRVGQIWDSVVVVISLLLFLSTALSISNIIYTMVVERTVEIGMLMALGAKPGDVRLLFTMEAGLIGFIGGTLGLIIGNGAVLLMDHMGIPFDSPFGTTRLIVHPKVHLGIALAIFAFGVLISQLSAIAPSSKAARVEPVVAFRGQIR